MKRGTRIFLLAGCAWVLFLDGPAALAALSASWHGPYPEERAGPKSAHQAGPRAAELELARR